MNDFKLIDGFQVVVLGFIILGHMIKWMCKVSRLKVEQLELLRSANLYLCWMHL